MPRVSRKKSLENLEKALLDVFAAAETLGATEKAKRTNRFSHIGSTAALDAVTYNKPIIDKQTQESVKAKLRKATRDSEALADIATLLGTLAGAAIDAAK